MDQTKYGEFDRHTTPLKAVQYIPPACAANRHDFQPVKAGWERCEGCLKLRWIGHG